jgi:hypothetical protein
MICQFVVMVCVLVLVTFLWAAKITRVGVRNDPLGTISLFGYQVGCMLAIYFLATEPTAGSFPIISVLGLSIAILLFLYTPMTAQQRGDAWNREHRPDFKPPM